MANTFCRMLVYLEYVGDIRFLNMLTAELACYAVLLFLGWEV